MWASNLPGAPGIYDQTLKLENGQALRYTLSIPSPFYPEQETPLILALHYGGTVTPWYGKGYLIILALPALKEMGAIIIAPDCPTPSGWNNPTAESAVLELLNNIKQNYKIDHKKILVTGFSMGGIGTWYMAARHPELFSAAIPIASVPDPEIIETIRDIPVYAIHSSGDEIFPVKKVAETIQKLKTRGLPVQLKILDGVSHYRTNEFIQPLHEALPWIKQVWEKNDIKK
ncbi:MAG TPA: dienelactone hydrolase family protein [Candidatus Deferrimicrobium sp.]|nr:dienelactone hydrolase family protein [Candidatus Deferrimicrobium sp.]